MVGRRRSSHLLLPFSDMARLCHHDPPSLRPIPISYTTPHTEKEKENKTCRHSPPLPLLLSSTHTHKTTLKSVKITHHHDFPCLEPPPGGIIEHAVERSLSALFPRPDVHLESPILRFRRRYVAGVVDLLGYVDPPIGSHPLEGTIPRFSGWRGEEWGDGMRKSGTLS